MKNLLHKVVGLAAVAALACGAAAATPAPTAAKTLAEYMDGALNQQLYISACPWCGHGHSAAGSDTYLPLYNYDPATDTPTSELAVEHSANVTVSFSENPYAPDWGMCALITPVSVGDGRVSVTVTDPARDEVVLQYDGTIVDILNDEEAMLDSLQYGSAHPDIKEGALKGVTVDTYFLTLDMDPYDGLSSLLHEASDDFKAGTTYQQAMDELLAEDDMGLAFSKGDQVMLGNGLTCAFTGWYSPVDLSAKMDPADFTTTTYTAVDSKTGLTTRSHTLAVEAQWEPVDADITLPVEPRVDGLMRPYTIKDGVMTFDDARLGTWNALSFDLGDGVTSKGFLRGDLRYTGNICSGELLSDPEHYVAGGFASGPYYLRNATPNTFSFTGTGDEELVYALAPASAGTVTEGKDGTVQVTLTAPATLSVRRASDAEPAEPAPEEPATEGQHETPQVGDVLATNEQGASLTLEATSAEHAAAWQGVSLVTTWLGGDEAYAADDAVNAAVSGVTQMYVYDIHLTDAAGATFAVPEGDRVRVTLPLPDDMPADGVRVLHVADDGTVTDMQATVDAEERTASFTTDHFSTYVLARVADSGTGGAGSTQPVEPGTDAPAATASAAADVMPATGDGALVTAAAVATCAMAALLAGAVHLARSRR